MTQGSPFGALGRSPEGAEQKLICAQPDGQRAKRAAPEYHIIKSGYVDF
jgi:hypothetical protein